MYFDLNLALRVIAAPNSAFAQIRDSVEGFFAQSVGIFVLSSILSALLFLPFAATPIDYPADAGIPTSWPNAALFVGANMLTGLVSVLLIYFIGRMLGGSRNWRKVFSVVFHTYVLVFPMIATLAALALLMPGPPLWDLLAAMDEPLPPESGADALIAESLFYYIALVILVAVAFAAWILVVSVKAVKTVNGFGTAKAFGVVVLATVVSAIGTFPINM